jgi:hypothetical protein
MRPKRTQHEARFNDAAMAVGLVLLKYTISKCENEQIRYISISREVSWNERMVRINANTGVSRQSTSFQPLLVGTCGDDDWWFSESTNTNSMEEDEHDVCRGQ